MTTPRLRIVFFGTPDFAEASLRALAASEHEVVGVVTAPDRKAGRGQQLQPSRVKEAALELGLPITQPEKLRAPEFLDQLRAWNGDLFAVVAFRMLPEMVWGMPPEGTVNVHGSLLPDFGGLRPSSMPSRPVWTARGSRPSSSPATSIPAACSCNVPRP